MDRPALRPARRRPPAALRGFTLVELSIAVAVLGVLVSLAAPSLRDWLSMRRLQGAGAVLGSDLRFVRAEALARGEPLRLSLRPAADGSCYVVHTGAAAQCDCLGADGPAACSGGAEAIRTVRLPAAERVAVLANVASMAFDPARGTTTPAGTWRVVALGSGQAIHQVVSVMGRVRSCSPAPSVAGYRPC